MKKWNDKTKKIALAAALIAVGIGAFCGIRLCLITDKPVEVATETQKADEDDVNVVVDTEYEDVEVQETEELTVSTEPIDSRKTADTDDITQSIQNDPVKTEENKPSETPAEAATEAEQNGSSEKPENKKIPCRYTGYDRRFRNGWHRGVKFSSKRRGKGRQDLYRGLRLGRLRGRRHIRHAG